MGMLNWKITGRGGDRTSVLLYGEITEAVSFGELTQLRGRVVFDLAGVRRINSFGVRELLSFFDGLHRNGGQLEAERCSTAIVTQLNMLPEFTRRLRVRSILVPMECEKCLHEQEIAIELGASGRKPPLPHTRCDRCGSAMHLAEPEERYFAFCE